MAKLTNSKYRVELEFDIDESRITLPLLTYYLGYNQYQIQNAIFLDYDENDKPTYKYGIIPDRDCSFKVVRVEDVTDKK